MPYTRDPFVPTDFVNTPDPNNPPAGATKFTAEEADKLGIGIRDAFDSLHRSVLLLDANEYNAFNPVNEFPIASESWMTNTASGNGWPETFGILKTVRHRASIGDPQSTWDYQEYKSPTGNALYYRHSLAQSKPTWEANKVYAVNDVAQPNVDNGYYYRVTAITDDATSGATEPVLWRTDTTTFTDGNVTWERFGAFWSDWRKAVFSDNPTFTGKLVNTPSAVQQLATPSTRIEANARNILLNNSTAGSLTLNTTDIILDGLDGQEIMVWNVGTQPIVLTGGGVTNLRLSAATITLATRQSIRLVFLAAIGQWIQTNAVPTIV